MQAKIRLAFVAVAVAAVAAGCAVASASSDTVQKSFTVSPGGKLTIDSDLGSIEVRSGAADKVDVQVFREGANPADLKLDFQQDGDSIVVRGDVPQGMNWFGNRLKVKFVVTVPGRFDADLKTSGGSIMVSDLEGDVRVATSGGSLDLGAIRGPVHGRTSGGSIRLAGSSGDADIATSGGSISLGEVEGNVVARTSGGSIAIARARATVDAETSGGSISVEEVLGTIRASTSGGSITAAISRQPEADCRLATSGGGVRVTLGPGVAVDLDAKASGGKVTSEIPVAGGVSGKQTLAGTIRGGGPELVLRTSGGGIRISEG